MNFKIFSGKSDELINDQEETVGELKVDEKLTQNPNNNVSLESTNTEVKYYTPTLRCVWQTTLGKCCNQLFAIKVPSM